MNVRDRFIRFCLIFVSVLFAIIICFLTMVSLFSTEKVNYESYTFYLKDRWYVNILSICVFLAFIVVVNYYKERIKLTKAMVSRIIRVIVVIMGVFVLLTQLYPKSDQYSCWTAGIALVNGDYQRWLPNQYCGIYPFQNGFILLCALFCFLFGNDGYVVMQIVNIAALVAIARLSSQLIKRLWNVQITAYIYEIGILLYLPLSLYITYIYGILYGLAFALAAMNYQSMYFKSGEKKNIVKAGICIMFAVLIKQNYIIILITMCILFVIHAIEKKSMRSLKAVVYLIICLSLGNFFTQGIVENITGVQESKGLPSSTWVAIGLQESDATVGWFNNYPWDIYFANDCDYDKTKKVADEEVKNLLMEFKDNPQYACSFLTRKIVSQWNNPTFECFKIANPEGQTAIQIPKYIQSFLSDGGAINPIFRTIMNVQHLLILFGCIIFLICRRKENTLYHMIFAIIFLGGFLFHIFWEANTKYALSYFVLLIPYAVIGYKTFSDLVVDRIKKHKESKEDRKMLGRTLFQNHSIQMVMAILVVLCIVGYTVGKLTGFDEIAKRDQADYQIHIEQLHEELQEAWNQ